MTVVQRAEELMAHLAHILYKIHHLRKRNVNMTLAVSRQLYRKELGEFPWSSEQDCEVYDESASCIRLKCVSSARYFCHKSAIQEKGISA
jgi:hypothetical protein